MSLNQFWQTYRNKGYENVRTLLTDNALETFYLAILAFREQKIEHALDYAQQAKEQEPNSLVFTQAVTYLKSILKTGPKNVYCDDRGFAAFIRGGGNVPLYQKTSAALHSIYQEYETFSLLDIGVGDGMALLPALTDNIHHLDLLEPSEVMLNKLCAILDKRLTISNLAPFIIRPPMAVHMLHIGTCLPCSISLPISSILAFTFRNVARCSAGTVVTDMRPLATS